jgi:hypothetical protein
MPKPERKHVIISGKRFDEVILTQEQCNDYANRWKDLVGLKDWVVQVDIRRAERMLLNDAQGEVWADGYKQMANIHILDHVDFSCDAGTLQNMEKTIIHELNHVSLYPFKLEDKLHLQEEVYIEKQSHAMYELTQGRLP